VDGSLKAMQLDVLRRASRAARRAVRLLPASHTPLGVHESTSRSRGLLFAAFGVYAAAAHGCRTLAVPENGLLAVNPPLSPGRVAAASTRSVHPRTLDLLNATVSAVGGSVTVVNPFLHHTKGEVVRVALDAGLGADDLAVTLGCARPPAKRGRRHHHCGRCHACLVRRAGLRAALGHDPTGYETDLARLPLDGDRAVDLRAVLGWLRAPFTPADLVADLPIPAGYAVGDLAAVIGRAREELSAALGELVPAAAGAPVRRG
jgi:7-cyano-7-deazaguanine synthase in queuosine biosynthesis